MNNMYFIASVAIIALVTWLTRAVPFLLFGNREIPAKIKYLGNALPPAIMIILVCYCLRNMDFSGYGGWLPEIISCAVIVLVHTLRKNMYLSIIAGTVCYMVMLRIIV